MNQKNSGASFFLVLAIFILIAVAGRWMWQRKIEHQEEGYTHIARESLRLIGEANTGYSTKTKKYFMGYLNNTSALVTENLFNQENWESFPYRYQGADHPTKPCLLAKAERQGTEQTPYKDWIFCIDRSGMIFSSGETAGCQSVCLPGLPEIPPEAMAATQGPVCGNKICESTETPLTCVDCCVKDVTRPCCGDGICEGEEYDNNQCRIDCPKKDAGEGG